MTATWRATQKAQRRAELMTAAAALFAARGFAAVSTGDLGEAVGISGPALYKHFASKDALLEELLADTSERLLDGARQLTAEIDDPRRLLEALIGFHVDFALSEPDIIRIQDRELTALPDAANRRIRALQRAYVQAWDAPLAELNPGMRADERRTLLHALFGLLNSTPHSAGTSRKRTAAVLTAAAEAVLFASAVAVP
ncbi:TetR/AcrR family transcriptional regulator [Microbacterium sp. GXF7504]